MRQHLRKLAAGPAALLLAVGITACDDGGDSTETMVDEAPQDGGAQDGEEEPADLDGDVDAGGEDGTEETDGEPAEDADADLELDADDS